MNPQKLSEHSCARMQKCRCRSGAKRRKPSCRSSAKFRWLKSVLFTHIELCIGESLAPILMMKTSPTQWVHTTAASDKFTTYPADSSSPQSACAGSHSLYHTASSGLRNYYIIYCKCPISYRGCCFLPKGLVPCRCVLIRPWGELWHLANARGSNGHVCMRTCVRACV